MTERKPPKQYGVYLGKERIFPQKQKLKHGGVYELEILKPDKDYSFYRVKVLAPKWSLYIPYGNASHIWEDWMPYQGEVIE